MSDGFNDVGGQLSLWPASDIQGGSGNAWDVRQSLRSRRLTVRVFGDGRVEIVVPRGTAARTVSSFVARHREWIERKVEEARASARPAEAFPPATLHLAALDESWSLMPRRCARGKAIESVGHGQLWLHEGGNIAATRRALLRWLCEKARTQLGEQLRCLAAEQGLSYRRLEIRRQRTRWGSCSTRGTITLNCALLFQPPDVVRYLMIHELVHTLHMNHSRRFWNEVGRRSPDYRHLDEQLLAGWKAVPSWFFQQHGNGHGR